MSLNYGVVQVGAVLEESALCVYQMAVVLVPTIPLLGWMSFLSKGAAPTTNRAVFGEVAGSSSCEAPLRFLAPRLHLISFATAADQLMLRHFVDHYTSLGLAPARMRVFVFAPTGGGGEALVEMLHTRGMTQSRLVTAAYNDSFKLQLINDHYASLPEDAWAMTPDVDELYHYPCTSLPRLVSRGADLFCGIMEDMLAHRYPYPNPNPNPSPGPSPSPSPSRGPNPSPNPNTQYGRVRCGCTVLAVYQP